MKKKYFFIILPIILIFSWIVFSLTQKKEDKNLVDVTTYKTMNNNATGNSSASKSNSKKDNTSPIHEVLREIETLCTVSKKDFPSLEDATRPPTQLARNLHFKKNGEVYRLRTFIEDSQESSYEKLVYYKEDSSGFAQILKIPETDSKNPTPEVLEKYLAEGEVIYDEKDIRLQVGDIEINYSTINGRIVKVVSNQLNCYYDSP